MLLRELELHEDYTPTWGKLSTSPSQAWIMSHENCSVTVRKFFRDRQNTEANCDCINLTIPTVLGQNIIISQWRIHGGSMGAIAPPPEAEG